MYSSPEQRAADIEAGAQPSPQETCAPGWRLRHSWLPACAGLVAEQWQRPVRTAQGRTVPATEIPWLRAREVMVHAVDLDAGVDLRRPAGGLPRGPGRRHRGEALHSDGPALTVTADPGDERGIAGRSPVELEGRHACRGRPHAPSSAGWPPQTALRSALPPGCRGSRT